jgi:hypothetical protein
LAADFFLAVFLRVVFFARLAAFLPVAFLADFFLVAFFARLATFLRVPAFLARFAVFLPVAFFLAVFLRVDFLALRAVFLVAFLRLAGLRAAFLAVFRTVRLADFRLALRLRAFATHPPGESTLAPWMRGFGCAYGGTPSSRTTKRPRQNQG